jgi:hypothetical protein
VPRQQQASPSKPGAAFSGQAEAGTKKGAVVVAAGPSSSLGKQRLIGAQEADGDGADDLKIKFEDVSSSSGEFDLVQHKSKTAKRQV